MKITAITQQKKRQNRYNVFIDNEFAFGIDGVDLLYYKLKEGIELTRERYDLIMDELVFVKARETAMRYIDFKRRTEKEVRQKLGEEFGEATTERVIELLKRYRVIDDEEYARLYITDCLKLKGWGTRRILTELAARGIDRGAAETYLEGSGDAMREKAEKLLEKRIKNGIADRKEYKKHMDFLLRRGFDFETAKNALNKYKNDMEE